MDFSAIVDQDGDANELKGWRLEERVARHPGRYLVEVLERPTAQELEAFDLTPLSVEERRQLRVVDLIVAGRPVGGGSSGGEVLAAVEVSWRAHVDDVERVVERARLLARVSGMPVVPVVVSQVDPGAAVVERAVAEGVAMVAVDGPPPTSTGQPVVAQP